MSRQRKSEHPESILPRLSRKHTDLADRVAHIDERLQLTATDQAQLTALKREDDVVSALKLGAADYLAKPFNPVELVVRLQRFVTAVSCDRLCSPSSCWRRRLHSPNPAMTKPWPPGWPAVTTRRSVCLSR